jgi:predicted DNA-binding protein (MmcQ/YjbR family)
MLTATVRGRALVNLKCDPQKSLLHQAIYRSIEPGYHMNKSTGSPWFPARISA